MIYNNELSALEEYLEALNKNKDKHKTLRDEFAMAALTGLIVRAKEQELCIDLDITINKAFYIADRAMKVRKK